MSSYTYRLIAVFLVAMCCFWVFSVAIHDILYPVNNLKFVTYILKGDGTESSLSVTNQALDSFIFYFAVFFETVVFIVLLIASLQMIYNFNRPKFRHASNLAIWGFALVLFKYFVFFVTISAEWFYMWKTSEPSQIKGILFSNFALLGIIFLNLHRRAE